MVILNQASNAPDMKDLKQYQLDSLSPDPWLFPPNLDRVDAISNVKALERVLYSEKYLEFEDDALHGFSAKQRSDTFAKDEKRLSRGRKPSDGCFNQDHSERFVDPPKYYVGFFESDLETRPELADVYSPLYTLKGSTTAEDDERAQNFFSDLREIAPEAFTLGADDCSGLISSMIWIHTQILLQGTLGIFEFDLRFSYCRSFYGDGQLGRSHKEVQNEFDAGLIALEALRAIVRVPALSDYRILSPHGGANWMFPLRPIKKSEALINLIRGVLKSDTSNLEANDDAEISDACLVEMLSGVLTDEVVGTPFIPKELFDKYGIPPGGLASHVALEFGKTLDSGGRKALSYLLRKDAIKLRKLIDLQTAFADLRTSLALKGDVEDENCFLFETTAFLGVSANPPRTWMRLDGRLNTVFLAIVISRIFMLLQESPGLSLADVNERLSILDRCELRELMQSLVRSGVISPLEEERSMSDTTRLDILADAVPSSACVVPQKFTQQLDVNCCCVIPEIGYYAHPPSSFVREVK